MLNSSPFRFNNTSLASVLEASNLYNPSSSSSSSMICCSSRNNAYIPKLEPFSRSKFDRMVRDPPLIQKAENELADYCSTLEGDKGYSCWKAYFELKDLERETPKEEVESLILQTGGVKSLIGCLHGISAMHKEKKEFIEPTKISGCDNVAAKPSPIPDGLPKSTKEIEEEENAKMPDSPFTVLLRTKGKSPAWYSPVPDHG